MRSRYDNYGVNPDDEGVGDSRGNQFVQDVRETSFFGNAVVQPSVHFQRIFALFDQKQRIKFVEFAYKESVSLGKRRQSIDEFVIEILELDLSMPEELQEDPTFNPTSDDRREAAIRQFHRRKAKAVLRGDDYRTLAKLLVNSLFPTHEVLDTAAFNKFFSVALGSAILLPAQAAAVATCVSQSRVEFKRFEREADYLLLDADIVGRRAFDSGLDYRIARERTEQLKSVYKIFKAEHPSILHHQNGVVRPDDLIDRFNLKIVADGLFLPIRKGIAVAKTMEEAIRMAEADKSSLLSMEPRRFEEFMADLFRRLGFEVELTQATRDGGADLLCLRNDNGIPFRFAVEIKRYKEDRPIDVSLVRAFVGANVEQRANQLVYVTTSSYTRPALDYAKKCPPYFLNLKKYDQIQQWCRSALSQPHKLL